MQKVQPIRHMPPPIGHAGVRPDTIAPDGSEIRLLAGAENQSVQASLCEVTLPAGQVSRPIWHQTVEEIWYILEGHGEVWRCPPDVDPAGVAAAEVGPGDTLVIPTGWRFQFRSAGEEALRFLCYTSPPWPGPAEAQPAPVGGLGAPTVSE